MAANLNKPPARRAKPTKNSQLLAKVQNDSKTVEEIRQKADGLLFFDHQSPKTRAARAVARQVFEEYCERKLGRTDLTDGEMWNVETFIDRSCDLILGMGMYATGAFKAKPKAGILMKQKFGIDPYRSCFHDLGGGYWWAIRFIPTFTTIFQLWDTLTTSAVQKAAMEFNFNTASLPKNKLTDAELALFWNQLFRFPTAREDWKQHYVAWLMVYVTAVRPGSFTVCEGYSKNDLLANGSQRTEDETLRWSDIKFIRQQGVGGFILEITFRYLKGYRNQHTKKHVEGKRVFKLFPLNSDRYEYDLGLLLTALAFSRGLFSDFPSIEALFQGTERIVRRSEAVDKQAVFLSSNQAGVLDPGTCMHTSSLNPKLRTMCDRVGLLGRNTMYSLRRAAITKIRREKGTEMARELAAHVPEGRSLYAYDDQGLGDYDVLNEAMNAPAWERKQIGEMFLQVNVGRIELPADLRTPDTAYGTNMQEQLNTEARAMARDDDEYLKKETLLQQHLDVVAEYLGLDIIFIRNVNDHKTQLQRRAGEDDQAQALLDTLDELVRARSNMLRWLVQKYKNDLRAKKLKDAQEAQQTVESGTHKNPTGVGFSNAQQAATQASVRQAVTAQGSAYLGAIRGLDVGTGVGVDAMEEEDDEADERIADNGRHEPRQWADLPAEVVLQPGLSADEGGATHKGRVQFAETFIRVRSEQTSNLPCVHCKLDPTVPFDKKKQVYTLTTLDKHLKSSYHTREQQIERAVMIDGGPDSTKTTEIDCPLCPERVKAGRFAKHIREDHEDAFAG